MPSRAQSTPFRAPWATQISVCFVCVYVPSTLPFIAVSNRLSRCLDHCFRSFRSLFKLISIDYKTLEHCHPRVALKSSLIILSVLSSHLFLYWRNNLRELWKLTTAWNVASKIRRPSSLWICKNAEHRQFIVPHFKIISFQ